MKRTTEDQIRLAAHQTRYTEAVQAADWHTAWNAAADAAALSSRLGYWADRPKWMALSREAYVRGYAAK